MLGDWLGLKENFVPKESRNRSRHTLVSNTNEWMLGGSKADSVFYTDFVNLCGPSESTQIVKMNKHPFIHLSNLTKWMNGCWDRLGLPHRLCQFDGAQPAKASCRNWNGFLNDFFHFKMFSLTWRHVLYMCSSWIRWMLSSAKMNEWVMSRFIWSDRLCQLYEVQPDTTRPTLVNVYLPMWSPMQTVTMKESKPQLNSPVLALSS